MLIAFSKIFSSLGWFRKRTTTRVFGYDASLISSKQSSSLESSSHSSSPSTMRVNWLKALITSQKVYQSRWKGILPSIIRFDVERASTRWMTVLYCALNFTASSCINLASKAATRWIGLAWSRFVTLWKKWGTIVSETFVLRLWAKKLAIAVLPQPSNHVWALNTKGWTVTRTYRTMKT